MKKTFIPFLVAGSLGLLATSASAQLVSNVTFGSSADYDNSTSSQTTGLFRDTTNNNQMNRVDDGGNGVLRFTSSSTQSAATFYDTTPSEGTVINTFLDTTIRVDIRFSAASIVNNTFGIYARTDSVGQAAYMFLLTPASGGSSTTFRLFKTSSSSTAYGANAGTQIGSSVALAAGTLTADTFYTMEFSLQNTTGPAGVALTGKLFQQATSNQIGSTLSFTDTTSPLLSAGQIGLRFRQGTSGSSVTDADNFNVVPEPSTFVMLLGGLGVLVLRRRRR